jgi:hypothetical protein
MVIFRVWPRAELPSRGGRSGSIALMISLSMISLVPCHFHAKPEHSICDNNTFIPTSFLVGELSASLFAAGANDVVDCNRRTKCKGGCQRRDAKHAYALLSLFQSD